MDKKKNCTNWFWKMAGLMKWWDLGTFPLTILPGILKFKDRTWWDW